MTRHRFDLVSFLPGVLAVAIAVVALADGLTVDLLTTDWVWPAVLIGLGLLVLASAGIGRRGPDPEVGPPDDDARADTLADAPADTLAETTADTPTDTTAPDAQEEWPVD